MSQETYSEDHSADAPAVAVAHEKQEAARTPDKVKSPEAPHGLWQRIKHSVQAAMPPAIREHSSRINQLGLMLGTAVIIGSVFRGRTISRDIFKAQEKILMEKGFQGEALKEKVAELLKSKVMKTPTLHRQRMLYLPTAVLGLAVGGFLKDKETPEQREEYKNMPLPNYIAMRLKQAFDPVNHSRQTAGVIGALSGAFAIISALSQPGGVLVSEAFVGGTLISGFSCLTLINDPAKAKQWLNLCWASRLPFVMTGTYETLLTKPVYTNPLASEIKQTAAFKEGMVKVFQEGIEVPRMYKVFGPALGVLGKAGKKMVKGGEAVEVYSKRAVALNLPYKRMDISYPIGQWFNMAMATFGFLMAGSDEKKTPEASKAVVDVNEHRDAAVAQPHEKPAHQHAPAHAPAHSHAARLHDGEKETSHAHAL